jgi:hypothetical protein
MKKLAILAAATAATLAAVPASAQVSNQQRNPIEAIFGALFGDRLGVTTTLESEWGAGRTPLLNQRAQFNTRVDTQVNAGALSTTSAARLKSDYAALVQLESQYGVGGFSAQERADLAARYGNLTQVLTAGGYADTAVSNAALVADGRAEFNARVDAAVAARRMTRTQGTRLKNDYAALATREANYLRDGIITDFERNDIDTRLDALDARVGDVGLSTVALTARQRLDAVIRALPTAGLGVPARTRLQVEAGDLMRLEAAYARMNPTAEERAYLESRIADLETRARLR